MWNKLLLFLKPNSGFSSKRLISVGSFLLFVVMVICSYCGIITKDIFIENTIYLILGGSGLTLLEKNKNKNNV